MVDIHCHVLPGLDDGAESLEQAEEMARMAIDDGITHVVATPHANAEYRFDPELIRRRCDELQTKVGDRLKLATGCDFHLSEQNLADLPRHPAKYTINQKNYLLIEFADFEIPASTEQTIEQLCKLGLFPIVTHPERNRLIRSQTERMRSWINMGCYVQITAQSLLGRWGDGIKKQVEQWLDEEVVHFFASDAHDTLRRPLRLRAAYEMVADRCGEPRARALFVENPLAAFEGRPLPYRPKQEPTPAANGGRRKRFRFF